MEAAVVDCRTICTACGDVARREPAPGCCAAPRRVPVDSDEGFAAACAFHPGHEVMLVYHTTDEGAVQRELKRWSAQELRLLDAAGGENVARSGWLCRMASGRTDAEADAFLDAVRDGLVRYPDEEGAAP